MYNKKIVLIITFFSLISNPILSNERENFSHYSENLQKFFNAKRSYKPKKGITLKDLSKRDKENISLIKEIELERK